MDDPLLVRVLDRPADRDEQLQPLAGRELGFIAILGDRDAADQLRRATPDGAELAATLSRLLDLKDAAHYGVMVVASRKARDALRWSTRLVDRARQESER